MKNEFISDCPTIEHSNTGVELASPEENSNVTEPDALVEPSVGPLLMLTGAAAAANSGAIAAATSAKLSVAAPTRERSVFIQIYRIKMIKAPLRPGANYQL